MLHRDVACLASTSALFNALSPDVARALSVELGLREGQPIACTPTRSPAHCELRALAESCRTASRGEVLAVARQRFRLTRPNWTALLPHWSTSDVVVRLYLESRSTFVEAQRSLLLYTQGELELRRASYVADVVPSLDRTNKMKEALASLLQQTPRAGALSPVARVFAGEHELALFVGQTGACARPEPMNARSRSARRYRLALLFHYETAVILVKAPTQPERHQLCEQFAAIFARDPDYFARPVARLGRSRNRWQVSPQAAGGHERMERRTQR